MLSDQVKNWLLGPKALIVLAALIGLMGWGGSGLIIGAVLGFALSLAIGVVLTKVAGGTVPPKARRDLIMNLMDARPNAVAAAYPLMDGKSRFAALEQDLETIVQKAVTVSPSHELVWSQGVILHAAELVRQEQPSEERRELFQVLADQINSDWYVGGGYT